MQNAISYIRSELQGQYPETEIKSFTFLILEKVTGYSKTEIILNKNSKISDKQIFQVRSFVEKLKKREPVQYILGETEFMGLKFKVDPSVLIPRPETEELVEWICSSGKDQNIEILDIGTGSGCIAIALKKLMPDVNVTAFDISEEALSVAQSNAESNKVDVFFEKQDILLLDDHPKKWDLIVSNPPYIPEKEKINIHENVLDFEPHQALFVPDEDPLVFYKKISSFAQNHLKNNGKIFFEIHFDQGTNIVELLKDMHFTDIELKKDLSGNDRMIKAVKS